MPDVQVGRNMPTYQEICLVANAEREEKIPVRSGTFGCVNDTFAAEDEADVE